MTGERARGRSDAGLATVFACVGIACLLGILALAVGLGSAVLARQRAENGADLAALAAAGRVLDGATAACAEAGRIADLNGTTLESCALVGLDVRVVVRARADAGPLSGEAVARARAGPVSAASGPG